MSSSRWPNTDLRRAAGARLHRLFRADDRPREEIPVAGLVVRRIFVQHGESFEAFLRRFGLRRRDQARHGRLQFGTLHGSELGRFPGGLLLPRPEDRSLRRAGYSPPRRLSATAAPRHPTAACTPHRAARPPSSARRTHGTPRAPAARSSRSASTPRHNIPTPPACRTSGTRHCDLSRYACRKPHTRSSCANDPR